MNWPHIRCILLVMRTAERKKACPCRRQRCTTANIGDFRADVNHYQNWKRKKKVCTVSYLLPPLLHHNSTESTPRVSVFVWNLSLSACTQFLAVQGAWICMHNIVSRGASVFLPDILPKYIIICPEKHQLGHKKVLHAFVCISPARTCNDTIQYGTSKNATSKNATSAAHVMTVSACAMLNWVSDHAGSQKTSENLKRMSTCRVVVRVIGYVLKCGEAVQRIIPYDRVS